MSEAYKQKEWELNSLIDNLSSIEYTYDEYKKEVEYFIDRLLENTKEINVLRNQLQQKENIIKEVRKYIEEHKQKGYRTPMSDDYEFWNELNENEIKELLEILDKENK